MSDKNTELLGELLAPDTNASIIDQSEEGFIHSILKKISDNKMYIYIGIIVIILGLVLHYFFNKNKKETMGDTSKQFQLALPTQYNVSEPLNSHNQEYYVLDNNGNPIKVSGSFPTINQPVHPLHVPLQQPSQQDVMMLQKQMMEKMGGQPTREEQMREQHMHEQHMREQMHEQHMREQMHEQPMREQMGGQHRSKMILEHPSNDETVNVDSDDEEVDVDLARVKANEDVNIAEHNLTHSELAEINKKLEMMNS